MKEKKGNSRHKDLVILEMMRHFGFYITESSEHNAEYTPYWIKKQYPALINEFNIPLDEYSPWKPRPNARESVFTKR